MRTDSQIQGEVINKLKLEPSVDSASIGVAVKDGVVTLTGQVASMTAKYVAERAAQGTPGVKALAIEIELVRQGDLEHTGAALARAVGLALESKHGLAKDFVRVMVEDGCVTLSGETESERLRTDIADTVSGVQGVSGIKEKVTLRHALAPAVSRTQFAADMERRCDANTYNDIATQI